MNQAAIAAVLRLARCTLFPLCLLPLLAFGQSGNGELRISVRDPAGLPIPSSVQIVSQGSQVGQSLQTDKYGRLVRRDLPLGNYLVRISHSGFAIYSTTVQVSSKVPVYLHARLAIQPANSDVLVTDSQTLVDPERTGNVVRLGAATLDKRSVSLPGRSVIDIVSAQPGWVLESNGTLHPRGSENQVQYVIDGIPLTENRSPAFSAGVQAEDVQSMEVLTGDFPAEFGRKLGGVIEMTSKTPTAQGLHGQFAAGGGSFASAGGYAALGYGWDKNALTASVDAEATDRYLDPPVRQNFTNHGGILTGQIRYEREISMGDRAIFSLRHEHAGFDVPNEFLQQQAGQRQNRADSETMGSAAYEHVISSHALADVRFMARDVSATLLSNEESTPVIASQQRGFREGYGKATVSLNHGMHELKAGLEFDYSRVHEQFAYNINDPSLFDPGTPANFHFFGRGSDREEALFFQDLLHAGDWSISAGLRYDHYGFLVNRSGLSPRLGVAWYWPSAQLNLHASFDRVFQTPASENILLSSSSAVQQLSPQVLRLPVEPSTGNYFDAGLSKGLLGSVKLDIDWYRRSFRNYADDDLLLNTGVAFPISFQRAHIYGSEAKLTLPHWKKLSGFLSYSYMVGFAYSPVTGGLFLGGEAAGVLTASRFPITQDQRNTVAGRTLLQLTQRLWTAFSASYGSGLPTEFDGTQEDAVQQFGAAIVQRVDFARGRVRPSLAVGASFGTDLLKRDTLTLRVQADAENINNRINVINFAGLFSGTGIAAPRTYAVRLQASF